MSIHDKTALVVLIHIITAWQACHCCNRGEIFLPLGPGEILLMYIVLSQIDSCIVNMAVATNFSLALLRKGNEFFFSTFPFFFGQYTLQWRHWPGLIKRTERLERLLDWHRHIRTAGSEQGSRRKFGQGTDCVGWEDYGR